jgi:plasmid stability protein
VATITVRNLEPEVRARLKRRAAEHERSMEAEARAILTAAVAPEEPRLATVLLELTRAFREEFGGVDLPLPRRTETARFVDFSGPDFDYVDEP